MSYPLLLLIVSLIIIVPTVFVVKGRSQQKRLTNKQSTTKYLGNSNPTSQQQGNKATAQQLQIASIIEKYRNHPALPISFRQLLGKIHSQYLELTSIKLASDQRFTVNKLASTRLSEIVEDYLALDTDYATKTIIDTENKLTSEDITYAQLMSILEFMQRAQSDGQLQTASNILANRSYLQSVYGDFHPDAETKDSLHTLKAPDMQLSELEDVSSSELMLERGLNYLQDCDLSTPNELRLAENTESFGQDILMQLGQLTFTAENTLAYSEALLGGEVNLSAFDQILAKSIPKLLRSVLSDSVLSKSISTDTTDAGNQPNPLTTNQKQLLLQKIARIQQLIDDCLNRLQKAADQQYQTGSVSSETLQSVSSTLKSKHSQAQYLLDSGFFSL